MEWFVSIPQSVRLSENDKIIATQQETGLRESSEAVSYVQVERPIDISAQIESERLNNNIVRFNVTISNSGDENERADRFQIINTLPTGVDLVPNSVRIVTENANGDEVRTNIVRNTSGISVRGHSFNAANRNLEVRLGDFRLYGDESVVIEFDVAIGTSIGNANIGVVSSNITAGRVSRTSPLNISTATAKSNSF
jgi:uncharacterized repeat protein (TIGR01451 family)